MSHSPPTATVPGNDPAGIVKDATYAFVVFAGTTISTWVPTLNAVNKLPVNVVVHGFTVVG
jgi:hypothetical protein